MASCVPAPRRATMAPTTMQPRTAAPAAMRRARTVGSVCSAARSAGIDANRASAEVASPRSRIRRVQPGTRAFGGGALTAPVVTFVMSARNDSPSNGRHP